MLAVQVRNAFFFQRSIKDPRNLSRLDGRALFRPMAATLRDPGRHQYWFDCSSPVIPEYPLRRYDAA
jgi:hypothetical protein